ncbi:MAG TPA: LptF/LptG family permease [Saprospiraceae bacterium]|nr:LptF/LptG family permease [Saprospiraceae bacterium]
MNWNLSIKKIDKLIVQSFWAPYIMSFFVAEFVLVMQFMWKYIDDILGKGIPFTTLIELVFYFALTIIPMAIPLTILISSIMVFGNLSERYELSSMKSAGISLIRIMKAAIIISILTAGFSYVASNYLKPRANYKFYQLFLSIRKQKPSLTIEQGIFNKDFRDYVIRVGEKDRDGRTIKDVVIYDHTDIDKRLVSVITAKEGEMYSTSDNTFVMELSDGYQFREMKDNPGQTRNANAPLMRTHFNSFIKVFDMSDFALKDNSVTSRNKHDMLSRAQLLYSIDSLERARQERIASIAYDYGGMLKIPKPPVPHVIDAPSEEFTEQEIKEFQTENPSSEVPVSIRALQRMESKISQRDFPQLLAEVVSIKNAYTLELKELSDNQKVASFIELVPDDKKIDLLDEAMRDSNSFNATYSNTKNQIITWNHQQEFYRIRLHQMFSWAVMCIVFLFIGAPLGSIIRKGGYGYPLLIAIIFYVMFIISSIMGEKLIRRNTISAILAAWIPVVILTPIAISFTLMALRDVKFDLMGKIKRWFPSGESA